MIRHFAAIILTLLSCTAAVAQTQSTEKSIEFRIGKYDIDPSYRTNSARISDIISFLNDIKTDSTVSIVSVCFRGSTSPEGSYQLNRRLADRRLSALEKLVRDNIQIPDSIITRDPGYIAWDELRQWVVISATPYKDEVLEVLDQESTLVNYGVGLQVDSRLKTLKTLRGGKSWNYIYHNYFETMRNAGSVFVTLKKEPQPQPIPEPEPEIVEIPEPVEEVCEEPVIIEEPDTLPAPEPKKPWYIALKTNLLYDLAAVPNLGGDIYLGKRWSIDGNWMYAWWKTDVHHRYWRTYGGDLAVRKWFGKKAAQKPLTGHHVGIYGQIVTYDFEWGGRGYLGDRWTYGGGLEYGYSAPIARRLNLDFTIGLGYLRGEYKEYLPIDTHYVWQVTKMRNWFGPTKLEVSLVWLIGRGNFNQRRSKNSNL
jgi:hypothetical protein